MQGWAGAGGLPRCRGAGGTGWGEARGCHSAWAAVCPLRPLLCWRRVWGRGPGLGSGGLRCGGSGSCPAGGREGRAGAAGKGRAVPGCFAPAAPLAMSGRGDGSWPPRKALQDAGPRLLCPAGTATCPIVSPGGAGRARWHGGTCAGGQGTSQALRTSGCRGLGGQRAQPGAARAACTSHSCQEEGASPPLAGRGLGEAGLMGRMELVGAEQKPPG